jgi:hypothetical protein
MVQLAGCRVRAGLTGLEYFDSYTLLGAGASVNYWGQDAVPLLTGAGVLEDSTNMFGCGDLTIRVPDAESGD